MEREKKSKIGLVTRHSGDKTAVVLVKREVKHPVFKKYVTKRKKFHIHDEKNAAGEGDKVKIVECRPISKSKSWRLDSILEKAK
jgi:small subunit ribosomal protein S17